MTSISFRSLQEYNCHQFPAGQLSNDQDMLPQCRTVRVYEYKSTIVTRINRSPARYVTSVQDCKDDRAGVPRCRNWNSCQGCWKKTRYHVCRFLRASLKPQRIWRDTIYLDPPRPARSKDVLEDWRDRTSSAAS